jgi:hypothetical protein
MRDYIELESMQGHLVERAVSDDHIINEFDFQFFAETIEELEFISDRFRQDFESPGFSYAVIENPFGFKSFFQLNKENFTQIIQILASQTPAENMVKALNDPRLLAFDSYLVTTDTDTVVVLESPRDTWSHGH